MTDPKLARYAGVGMQFSLTIAVFAWLGYWADGKLGTSPGFLIAGVMLGFGGALYSLVKKFPPSTPPS